MAEQNADYLSAVNGVISICKDAEQGFTGAASAVTDPSLKSFFSELSTQRGNFVRELQSVVESAGEHAAHPSGVAGVAHEAWIRLKGTLTGHSSHQILEETERGEDLSLKRYREALSRSLPATLKQTLETQFQAVQSAHNRIKALRDQTGASAAKGVGSSS